MSALVGAEAWFLYNLQAEKDMAMTQKKNIVRRKRYSKIV